MKPAPREGCRGGGFSSFWRAMPCQRSCLRHLALECGDLSPLLLGRGKSARTTGVPPLGAASCAEAERQQAAAVHKRKSAWVTTRSSSCRISLAVFQAILAVTKQAEADDGTESPINLRLRNPRIRRVIIRDGE